MLRIYLRPLCQMSVFLTQFGMGGTWKLVDGWQVDGVDGVDLVDGMNREEARHIQRESLLRGWDWVTRGRCPTCPSGRKE